MVWTGNAQLSKLMRTLQDLQERIRRPDVLSSILLSFNLIMRGLLACLLATLLILTDRPSHLVKGLFFPSGSFS